MQYIDRIFTRLEKIARCNFRAEQAEGIEKKALRNGDIIRMTLAAADKGAKAQARFAGRLAQRAKALKARDARIANDPSYGNKLLERNRKIDQWRDPKFRADYYAKNPAAAAAMGVIPDYALHPSFPLAKNVGSIADDAARAAAKPALADTPIMPPQMSPGMRMMENADDAARAAAKAPAATPKPALADTPVTPPQTISSPLSSATDVQHIALNKTAPYRAEGFNIAEAPVSAPKPKGEAPAPASTTSAKAEPKATDAPAPGKPQKVQTADPAAKTQPISGPEVDNVWAAFKNGELAADDALKQLQKLAVNNPGMSLTATIENAARSGKLTTEQAKALTELVEESASNSGLLGWMSKHPIASTLGAGVGGGIIGNLTAGGGSSDVTPGQLQAIIQANQGSPSQQDVLNAWQ